MQQIYLKIYVHITQRKRQFRQNRFNNTFKYF